MVEKVINELKLQLFVDNGEPSTLVRDRLIERGENFSEVDIKNLVIHPDEGPIEAPTLYAPEGTYIGYEEIMGVYLNLPIETINRFRRRQLAGE